MRSTAKKRYYAYVVPGVARPHTKRGLMRANGEGDPRSGVGARGERDIVEGWDACARKVSGVSGARYRGFAGREEAEAWLRGGAVYEARPPRPKAKLLAGIYFDAGTGRGDGVEVSVTDERGRDLLGEALPPKKINKFGKHRVPGAVTNNYGELLACFYAIEIAMKRGARPHTKRGLIGAGGEGDPRSGVGVKRIFGDSKLVLDYWSRGVFKEKALSRKTANLIHRVAEAREAFEKAGGRMARVSGDDNPADLGFH